MRWNPTRAETLLLATCLVLLAAALALPAMPQPGDPHAFADGRTLAGVPNALDVLSNLAFAAAGALGLARLARAPLAPLQRACAALFFLGLLATAAGSGIFHWTPDAIGLALDRAGMAVAFAGLLGLLAATQVSDRAGGVLACALLAAGPAAAWLCAATGNVVPWAVLQFGGMALVLALAFVPARPGALQVRWGWVIAAYALAKAFEVGDHAVFAATGELLSGHTAKHLVAALAAWPVIAAVAARARGQNGAAGARAPLARA